MKRFGSGMAQSRFMAMVGVRCAGVMRAGMMFTGMMLAGGVATGWAASAQAQDGAERERKVPPSIQRQHERRLAEMMAYDLNDDGLLQLEELLASIEARFDAADADKDGVLSVDELGSSVSAFKEERGDSYGTLTARKARDLGKLYRKADANKDGQVSREEFRAYFSARYGAFDRDGDGVVSVREYRMDVEDLPGSYHRR